MARVVGLTLLASCSPSPRAALTPAPSPAECQVREAERLAKLGFRPGMDLDSLREASLDSTAARFRERRRPAPETVERLDPGRLDRAPKLLNAESIQRWMSINYPPTLLSQGVGGTTTLLYFARPDSTPAMIRVLHSSGWSELDLASVRVIQESKMAPGIYRGCPVWAVITMPITWAPRRAAATGSPR
jgi:outer membrane biosynthesis protein TonB